MTHNLLTSIVVVLLSAPVAASPSVGPDTVAVPAATDGGELDIVIEMFAAPYFGLQVADAWYAYEVEGSLTIEQVGDHTYVVEYDGKVLEVVLEGGQ